MFSRENAKLVYLGLGQGCAAPLLTRLAQLGSLQKAGLARDSAGKVLFIRIGNGFLIVGQS